MQVVPAKFPFSIADGEHVEVSFFEGDLVVRFIDWREQRIEHRFPETLAFRWSALPTMEMPRDDSSFEVLESAWLMDEVRSEGDLKPEDFVHYVLCFNAAKVLEIISRRPTT